MLKRLHLQNFTVFADADFEFGPGLNVLVGMNGTGKSHVLKVGYAVEAVGAKLDKELARESAKDAANKDTEGYVSKPRDMVSGRDAWHFNLPDLLRPLFQVGHLDSLVRWDANGQTKITIILDKSEKERMIFEIRPKIGDSGGNLAIKEFTFETNSSFRSVFIPAKEILTLSWILPGSEQIIAPIEKNYLDLLSQLRLLPLRNPETAPAIQALTDILGGELQEQGDKYYLVDKSGRRIAISMVAEGLRKFGTLQKLLANGSLTKNTTLYWDEPEANLNPALLRELAKILAELARQGFQIILATHSMGLLKEFHILSREKEKDKLPIRYFGLNAEPGHATTVLMRDDFEYLPDVVALTVELEQADNLEEIFAREDREYYASNRGEE